MRQPAILVGTIAWQPSTSPGTPALSRGGFGNGPGASSRKDNGHCLGPVPGPGRFPFIFPRSSFLPPTLVALGLSHFWLALSPLGSRPRSSSLTF
jgi:hypothetical protein